MRPTYIQGQGGGVLAPADKARFVVLLLPKGQAPESQWQRNMVAKKGVHPCALVISMAWVIDSVVLRRKLLDPIPYLVPAGTPVAPARSPPIASADKLLSRKRAHVPKPGPDPEPEESDSEYDEDRSDDEVDLGGASERDSRNVSLLIAAFKQWNGQGGKMAFIQHCVRSMDALS